MSEFSKFFLILITLKLFKFQIYCGIGYINYNVSFPTKKPLKSTDDNYRPIKIYIESSSLSVYMYNQQRLNIIRTALNYTANILKELIEVKPINYKIAVSQNDLNNWGFNNNNSDLIDGIDSDLIILIKYVPERNYYMSSEPKYIDEHSKRPIVGIVYISEVFYEKILPQNNSLYYTKVILLHQFTHILGFLKDTFNDYPMGIGNVIYSTGTNVRNGVNRNFIITPKVVEFAKKYYSCENLIGMELEDQEGRTNSHWEARTLLGEYMNSDHYFLEQSISEFTLALLEDSGWYKANYYTGGLMRYGKNKGCNFLNEDCNNTFQHKNEFFSKSEDKYGCSSGRQSRGYSLTTDIISGDIREYAIRFGKKPYFEIADFCFVFTSRESEENSNGLYVGSCFRGNGGYGTSVSYSDNYPRANFNLPKELGEKYNFNSFCVLSSVSIKNTNEFYKFKNIVIHPMCYPMSCSEKSLTIQIYNQFVVCPRSGGKVQVNGTYEGYLYCPDYNLICTGTSICNDMFDCVEKRSLIKNKTFNYDYEIKTNQILSELINEEVETTVYELSENGICPQNCEQCNNLKQCIICREGFYYIGSRNNESGPIICMNLTDISTGYYEIKENNKSIYYPCSNNCKKCNKSHCTQCDNYHKLDKNNEFCIEKVEHCGIYENVTYTCIKCKQNYYFIGDDRDYCHIIDISKYYTNDNGVSYILCNSSIPNCDECYNSTTCKICTRPFYFLEDNRGACFNDKNLSKYFTEDEGLSYFPCDKNMNYCDECTGRYNCINCISNYYLVNDTGNIYCGNIDIKKYYKEGIYLYPCLKAIRNCDECDQKYKCNKCLPNYYFLKDNRTFCRNDINIENQYYTDDKGISYYPCNNSFEFCDECINESKCTKCINSYGFFIDNYSKCIFVENNKYFSLDGGISFNFCNSTLPNCDECINNEYCTKCYQNFYFIKDDRSKCINDKNLSKYYTEDNGKSYFPCNEAIPHCDICNNNKSKCIQCESYNGYYFVGKDRTECRNDINISKYYTEDKGISFYPCNGVIDYCDICDRKDKCDKCINNYFFIGNDRQKCFNDIDYKKFYTKDNGLSFFPCNSSISNCDECFNENHCHKCYSSYILLYESTIECFKESIFLKNDEYYKLNETHYKKCSTSIEHCSKCNSYNNCTKCDIDYYFLNDVHKQCISERNILPKDEYFKFDEDNYYSCSSNTKGILNCQKCENNYKCQKCIEGFALIYNNFNECADIKKLQIGYYHNGDGSIYYPCIENCDECLNSFECEKCSDDYILMNDKTICENCQIKIENIDNEFDENTINITDYINLKKNALALHYINKANNYTKTIFKTWECTEELWIKNYFKINTSSLNNLMNKNLNIAKNNIIYIFEIKNYKNYLEIYNASNGQKIDIEKKCPDCIEMGFEITNNYSYSIQKTIAKIFINKIKENNIDIFNKNNKYISNLCQNFTISKIDVPIKDRISNLYVGEYSAEMICTDKLCTIDSYEISQFYGICKCRINTNINNLQNNTINILNSENNRIPFESSFSIFKCIKAGFSSYILSNTGLYLYGIFIFLQVLCFLFFICFEKKSIYFSPDKKENNSNPPKKELDNEILFIENFDVIESADNSYITCESLEKEIQEKDDGELIEEIDSYYINFSDTINNNINNDKDSMLTDLKSEKDSLNKGKRKSNSIRDQINFEETNNPFVEKDKENNKDNEREKESNKNSLVKFKKKLFKEKKYMKVNKSDLSLKYKEIISLNLKKPKNNKKKSEFYYANTEGNEKVSKINFRKKSNSKNMSNKRKNKILSDESARSKEELINIRDQINSIKKSVLESPDNISLEEAKASDKLSFCGFYWYLLGLKQPLLNLASQIKMFKITESFVPSGIKIIRFIFMLGLDFFVNSLFISQKYFSEKFLYFDKKYNLSYVDLGTDISTNERFIYAFTHTILFSVYSFLICYVFQAVINFFYFNLRKRINIILVNDCNVAEEIKDYLETVRIKYKFMFMINMLLMIAFWYYIINFSAVYRGGDLDYIASGILTFAILQIFPFFICLFLAIFRYCGLKKSERNIYKFSQIFAF